jgi:hypothetical protein
VVDVIAHSLGCSLIYAIGRGLERRTPPPVNWGQSKKWHRLGTFVALDGALHGLRPFAQSEWNPNGESMRELLTETEGGVPVTTICLGTALAGEKLTLVIESSRSTGAGRANELGRRSWCGRALRLQQPYRRGDEWRQLNRWQPP